MQEIRAGTSVGLPSPGCRHRLPGFVQKDVGRTPGLISILPFGECRWEVQLNSTSCTLLWLLLILPLVGREWREGRQREMYRWEGPSVACLLLLPCMHPGQGQGSNLQPRPRPLTGSNPGPCSPRAGALPTEKPSQGGPAGFCLWLFPWV